jgi:hypothetical protein
LASLPWRRRLADWPDEWRERWGVRANALEDEGLDWRSAEERAWSETLKEKRDGVSAMRVGANEAGSLHERAALREAALF